MKEIKKVTIFGSYNGNSIGDTAILIGILSSLERIFNEHIKVDVLVIKRIGLLDELKKFNLNICPNEIVINKFESNTKFFPKFSRLLKKIKNKFFSETIIDVSKLNKSLSNSDFLLIGGGNLIMDLFPKWPKMLKQVCHEANKTKTKYSIIGVGAGPINTQKGADILNKSLIGANSVYFRDNESKKYCNEILGFNDSLLIPDLALSIKHNHNNNKRKNRVLINVASLYGDLWPEKNPTKFKKYIDGMVNLTLLIKDSLNVDELVVFNSNYPTDKEGSDVFINQLQESVKNIQLKIISGRRSVFELIQIGETATLAVVTRLHAGIIAAHGGCNVIAIAYQPKVKDVLQGFGISKSIIDLSTLLDWDRLNIEKKLKTTLDSEQLKHNMCFQKEIDKIISSILK